MSDSDSQVLETPKPKRVRTEAQLEALARARVKAQEVRRANAEVRRKEKANAQAERDAKRKEIEEKYDRVVSKKQETPGKTKVDVQRRLGRG